MLPGRNDDTYFNCNGAVNYDPVICTYPTGDCNPDFTDMEVTDDANSQAWCGLSQTAHALFMEDSVYNKYANLVCEEQGGGGGGGGGGYTCDINDYTPASDDYLLGQNGATYSGYAQSEKMVETRRFLKFSKIFTKFRKII